MKQSDAHEFVYSFPLFMLIRSSDEAMPMQAFEGTTIVEVFTEEEHAQRALDEWDEEGELVWLLTQEEFSEVCKEWQSDGATHIAFDPEFHGAFVAPITEFIDET